MWVNNGRYLITVLTRGLYAILLNQINYFLQYSIHLVINEGSFRREKAMDFIVNSDPGLTLGVVLHGRLNLPRGHTMRGHKKPMQDDSKVYDVGHYIANVPGPE